MIALLADSATVGLWLGLPVVILTIVAGLVLVGICVYGEEWGLGAFVLLATVGFVIGMAFAYYPYKYDWHHWVPKEGVVEGKGSRLLAGSEGGTTQRIVLMINGTPYGVDDTRASLVKTGQRVKLRCKREHEFGQPLEANGWACKWGGVTG